MFAFEHQGTVLEADLIPGQLVELAPRPAATWFIVRRGMDGERTIYEILAGGYAKQPGSDIFETADIDPRDGIYLILVPGARRSQLLKAYPVGTRLETHTRMRDGLSLFAPHKPMRNR